MSELKTYKMVDEKYCMDCVCVIPSEVYLKSEADKVIAELKQKTNEAQTELELWRDGSIISEAHQKELNGKCHSDYKRCLAMALWCATERDIYHLIPQFEKMKFYTKWRKRWLELAEKFKLDSTAQQGKGK